MSYMERKELVERAENQASKIDTAVEDLWREWDSGIEDRDTRIAELEEQIEELDRQKDELKERIDDANSALALADLPTY
jgi:peptidoglycan hydrolase CwlO-like protein